MSATTRLAETALLSTVPSDGKKMPICALQSATPTSFGATFGAPYPKSCADGQAVVSSADVAYWRGGPAWRHPR